VRDGEREVGAPVFGEEVFDLQPQGGANLLYGAAGETMHEDPPVRADADRKGRVVVVVCGAKGDPALTYLPDSLKKGEDETQPV